MTKYAIESYLFPMIWPTLSVAYITSQQLTKWDKLLRSSALSAAEIKSNCGSQLSYAALHSTRTLPSLEDLFHVRRGSELLVTINSSSGLSGTTWARIAKGLGCTCLSNDDELAIALTGDPSDESVEAILVRWSYRDEHSKLRHIRNRALRTMTNTHNQTFNTLLARRVKRPSAWVRHDVLSETLIPWHHHTPSVCVTEDPKRKVEAYTDGPGRLLWNHGTVAGTHCLALQSYSPPHLVVTMNPH
jgi:hypothetical protein